MRLAVIGCGSRFREQLIPHLAASEAARLVSLVDPLESRLLQSLSALDSSALGKHPPPRTHSDYRSLAPEALDGILVCSPNNLHHEHASFGLDHDLRVYLEKPIACRVDQAQSLVDSSQGRVNVSVERPDRPDLAILRDRLRRGWLGHVRSVRYADVIRRAADFAASWRNQPELSGGGVLMDLGYHTVHALRWLFPGMNLASWKCDHLFEHGPFRVEQRALVRWTRPGTSVQVDVQLTNSESAGEQIEIQGDAGWCRLTRSRMHSPATVEIRSCLHAHRRVSSERVALDGEHRAGCLRRFLTAERGPSRAVLQEHLDTVRLVRGTYDRPAMGLSPDERSVASHASSPDSRRIAHEDR